MFALLLKGPTLFLIKKFKFSHSLSSLIVTFIFFTIILLILTFSVTALSSEVYQLTKTLSDYFSSNKQIPYTYFDELISKIQKYYDNLDPYIINSIQDSFKTAMLKLANLTANAGVKVINFVIAFASSIPYLLMVIVFTLIATYFFTKDISNYGTSFLENYLPEKTEKILYIYTEAKKMLLGYLASYLIIIFITFIVTLIGFTILGVNYTLVLSLVCAIFDFLPILGVATIYIPLSIIYLVGGYYFTGFGLIILYALVFIVRQIAEPKIVSSSLGIHPVSALAAIFIGLKANGISGMLFCMFLIVFYNILKKVNVL
jgi:sporulation integral membrane protein YtvI